MESAPRAAERARAGIRSWVRAAGSGLRRVSPYGIFALLAASAVAPIAGAALGASGEYAAALGQAGGMGSNYLGDVLADAARRLSSPGSSEPASAGAVPPEAEERWRDAVAAELLARLEDGDTRLRDDLAELLRSLGAVETALLAADDETRRQIAEALGEAHVLGAETLRVLDEIQHGLNEQAERQRRDTGRVLNALAATTALIRSLRVPGESTPAPVKPPAPVSVSPYPGLASFDVGDAPFFHGREGLIGALLGRLAEQTLGGPPLILVGASGVGKSSLLKAGLRPAVAADGAGEGSSTWEWIELTPGPAPLAALRAALGASGSEGRRVVLVDQFEELFTQCADADERAAFVRALVDVPHKVLILAVRADFYAQCTEIEALADVLARGQVVLGPLGEKELRRAITEPARDAGLSVEAGLVEVLLRDYEPGTLPLLAHALRATWERREGDTLTLAGYQRTGGVRRAVAETAEGLYDRLDEPGRAALRSELLGLVTVVDGLAVRRRAARAEVDMAVLGPLVAERLVTAGDNSVEISHEALLDGWPRLAGWLEDARAEIVLRQRLTQAAGEWDEAGEDPDLLYRGGRLAEAREWAAGRGDLPPAQARFLAASAALAEARQVAVRRTNRRLRRLVAGLSVALLLAVAGGLVALDQRGEARANGRAALSRQYALESHTQHYGDPANSVERALAAWAAEPTVEARGALMHGQHTQLVGRLGSRTGAASVAVSPDGRLVAAAYPDGDIDLWDTTTLQPARAALSHRPGIPFFLSFSPDGRFLASGSVGQGKVVVWEVGSGRLLHRLPAFGAMAWLPDSSAVLAARDDVLQTIGEWDPEQGRLIGSTKLPVAASLGVAVSGGGRTLAVASPDGGAIVERRGGAVRALIPDVFHVAAGPGDSFFTIGNGDGSPVQAWRAAAGWRPVTVPDPTRSDTPAPARRFAVTPDGTVIIGSGELGEILRLTLGGPRTDVTGLRGLPNPVALSADGRLLAVVGQNDPPTLMRPDASALPHPQIVNQLVVDPSGARVATGSGDAVIRIWDPRTGALRSTIAGNKPAGLAYGPDGSLAVSVDAGGRVVLFDAAEKLRHTLTIADKSLTPDAVAISPDGSLLAATTPRRLPDGVSESDVQNADDTDVIVWDAGTGRQRAQLKLFGGVPVRLAFTPDGRHLLVTSNRSVAPGTWDGRISRFRTSDLALLDFRDFPGDYAAEIAVSPDSATLALPGVAGVHLVRVDGLAPQRDLGAQPARLTRIAWSPDGRTLATGTDTNDGQIYLWDSVTGDRIAEVRGNSNQRGPLAFTPDGERLLAGLNDWTVGVWQIEPGAAIRSLCAISVPVNRVNGRAVPALCR
ncbi:hypothetical protein ACQP2X_16855 [Actinoplanes sp. CA-131856]